MSEFSLALKKVIRNQNTTILTLSKNSGVDRTSLQHMLTGKYLPASIEVVENILNAMILTPVQQKELIRLYYIARIGEDAYDRNLLVKNIFESVDTLTYPRLTIPGMNYQHDFKIFAQTSSFSSSHEVKLIIKAVLEDESSKDNGYVKLMLQPDFEFVMELMLILTNSCPQLEAEHIFCMYQDVHKAVNHQNLHSFKAILPLLIHGASYQPYIFYGNSAGCVSNASLFPFLIITSDKILSISYDLNQAILHQEKDIHAIYLNQFSRIKAISKPLIDKIRSPMDMYHRYSILDMGMNSEKTQAAFTYTLFSQPCLLFFVGKEHLSRYMYDNPEKENLIQMILHRNSSYLSRFMNGYHFTTYFTEEGLDDFWSTGRIREIPNYFYAPIDPEDRLQIIRTFIDMTLDTACHPIMINTGKFKLSRHMVVSAVDETSVILIYSHPRSGMMHFIFHEYMIASSFFHFIQNLSNSVLVYSEEESRKILKQKLLQYEEELQNSRNRTQYFIT